MATCWMCGSKFKVSEAREKFESVFDEEGYEYDDMYDGDVCGDCAVETTCEGMPEGAEIIELMGTGWDPD